MLILIISKNTSLAEYFDRKKPLTQHDATRHERIYRDLRRAILLRWYIPRVRCSKVKFFQDAGKRAQKESFGRRSSGEKGRNYVKSLENLSVHFLNSASRLAYYFYGSWPRKREYALAVRLSSISEWKGWEAYQICW